MNLRKEVIRTLERLCQLSVWGLTSALIWGMLVWMKECLNNTQSPIYIRLAIGFGVILILVLFFIGVLDDDFP